MSRRQLSLSQQLRQPRKEEIPAAKRSAQGRGNRDLLASLGAGKAMPDPVQAKMEAALGADFSGVRLYESPLVAQGGAEAAASGNKVAFAPGKLNLNSLSGLELLGHELSHVASQARGEVSGHGLVQDSALEHKADADGAKAMHAFDPVSGGNLTPMSTGPAPSMTAGPVQAKKNPYEGMHEGTAKGLQFRDALADMNMEQQVRAMRDMAVFQSYDVDRRQSRKEMDVVDDIHRANAQSPEFLDELVRQQIEAARTLNATKASILGNGNSKLDQDRANYLAKYSREATLFQGFGSLIQTMGMVDDGTFITEHMAQKLAQVKQDDPAAAAELEAAQAIIMNNETKNSWVHSETGGMAASPEEGVNYAQYINNQSNERDQALARQWKRPQARGFWSRLFRRKNRY